MILVVGLCSHHLHGIHDFMCLSDICMVMVSEKSCLSIPVLRCLVCFHGGWASHKHRLNNLSWDPSSNTITMQGLKASGGCKTHRKDGVGKS